MGSPKKNTLFSKPKSQSVAPIGGTFPVALSFTDNGKVDLKSRPALFRHFNLVPIYDATQGGFEFSQTDLEKIRELPLYQKGKKDLPPYAVVTVAYTVSSFPATNTSCDTGFLFNILFVLLLVKSLKDTED
jgi:hypothetical protein